MEVKNLDSGINSLGLSETGETSSSRNIQRSHRIRDVSNQLECSSCIQFLEPPAVVKCTFGHLICGKCIKATNIEVESKCPLECCNSPRLKIWNRVSQFLSICEPIKCKFQSSGCTYKGKAHEYTTHEAKCIFRSFMCPVTYCKKVVAKNDASLHIMELHSDMIHIGSTSTIQFPLEYPHEEVAFLVSKSNNNTMCIKIDLDYEGEFEIYSSLILSKDQSGSFGCELAFGEGHNLCGVREVIPQIEDGESRIFASNKKSLLKYTYSREQLLEIRFCIRDVSEEESNHQEITIQSA